MLPVLQRFGRIWEGQVLKLLGMFGGTHRALPASCPPCSWPSAHSEVALSGASACWEPFAESSSDCRGVHSLGRDADITRHQCYRNCGCSCGSCLQGHKTGTGRGSTLGTFLIVFLKCQTSWCGESVPSVARPQGRVSAGTPDACALPLAFQTSPCSIEAPVQPCQRGRGKATWLLFCG